MFGKVRVAIGLAAAMVLASVTEIEAQAPAERPALQQPATPPGTEEAPGLEDFEKGDLSRQDVEEEQERQADRNILSPSMQDGQPLDGWGADAND
jgi:hypothetical protein